MRKIESAWRIFNSRVFLWLILAWPFVWLLHAWRTEDLFYGEIMHLSGEFSARFLILAMAVTPLRLMFSKAIWTLWLLRRRRYFGVAAFAFAMLHAVVYLDKKQSFDHVLKEGLEFSMWTGWLALAIMAVLAATSNDKSVCVLKRAWKQLHRWVYPAALLTFLHWIFVAFDFLPGLMHVLVLLALESYRMLKRLRLDIHAA